MSGTPPRDWRAIKTLFLRAADLRPDERDAFLSRSCGGDQELRDEVASLLAAHDDDRPFLDAPAVAGAAHVLQSVVEDDEPPAGLPSGTRIAQYEVLERLGSGGMGDVYRARDTKLDRFVALKIVHDPAAGHSADRVLREARAASALNHVNVCTLYEAGEFDGQPYLAMEYIAGQPLSAVIPREGLAAGDVVKYGTQIADALQHAHEHHVVHRDLKSANVVVTPQGRAKVLDFGIAKRLATVGLGPKSGTLTEAGTITGTLAYMAPELFRDQAADARSDIWALGVLLYEMASGRRPFVGETAFEVTSAILKDPPPPLPAKVPPDLRAVILRCLERDPAARFQRASDVVAALDATDLSTRGGVRRSIPSARRILLGLGVAAALIVFGYAANQWLIRHADDRTSVAVMPFTVLSGAEEIGFLGIGVPDTITSRLAMVSSIRLRVMLSPGKEQVDPRVTGQDLGVDYVVTGTIQKGGDQVRITPQLLRVADGVAIWSRSYTLPSTDLLRLQDEIARAVVEALPPPMTDDDRARVYRRYTENAEAYASYLRGRAELARNSRPGTLAAVAAFHAALARDQEYALAHAGLAMASAKMRLFFAAERDVSTWYGLAHQAAQRALTLDPNLAETHEALAAVHRSTDFDWLQTIREALRALELKATLDQPHLYLASAFMHLGLLDRAEAETRAAVDINPANVAEPWRVQGVAAMFGGRFEEAVGLLERARAEGGGPTEWNLAYAYYYANRVQESESMLRTISGDSARSQRRAQATLAGVLAARGNSVEARGLIAAVLDGSYRDHHVAYALGAAYAQLGMPKEALERLTEARTTGFPCYPWFERDPLLEPLRRRPDFQLFMDEFRQSWETLKAQLPAR